MQERGVAEFIQAVTGQPEALEVLTIAGDPDALVRMRVDNVQHLQHVVDGLRRTGRVVGTRTLVVLSSWRRGDGTVPTTE